jgi:integrase
LENVKARIEGAKAELAVLDEQRNPPLTIRQAWSAYLATSNRPDTGANTLEKHEGKFTRFVAWIGRTHAGVRAMRDVTEEVVEAYAQDLSRTAMAAATFNAHIGLLRLVWRVLRKKAKTDRNPWGEIGRKRVVGAGRRELTVDELRGVCGSASGELRTLFALGLYCGLRLGDCATLRWGEVDLDRNIIRRIPSKTARRNPKPVLIPLHTVLKAMLAEIKIPGAEYVLPDTAALYLRDSSAVCKVIQQHFEACNIRTTKPGTGEGTGKRAAVEVGFHSLRHTFVSLCRESNAPLAVVEAIVGHSNPAMTRHYTHVSELAAASAVNGLPSVIGAEVKTLPACGSHADRPAPDPLATFKAGIRAIAERLTTKNATAIKAELLTMAG